MSLPDDATIEQLAEVFEVGDRVRELTSAAARLTKGQMLTLLGLDSEGTAARLIAAGTFSVPSTYVLDRNVRVAGLQLDYRDIQSLQMVFGPARLPAHEERAILEAEMNADTGLDPQRVVYNIYCCCCPCCCATAVLDPVQPTVA
jgi:hypothetical protein